MTTSSNATYFTDGCGVQHLSFDAVTDCASTGPIVRRECFDSGSDIVTVMSAASRVAAVLNNRCPNDWWSVIEDGGISTPEDEIPEGFGTGPGDSVKFSDGSELSYHPGHFGGDWVATPSAATTGAKRVCTLAEPKGHLHDWAPTGYEAGAKGTTVVEWRCLQCRAVDTVTERAAR